MFRPANSIHQFTLETTVKAVSWQRMPEDQSPLSPPQLMALAHARRDLRPAWALLLEFDLRLMSIAAKGQEPVLKQLRLAWWREQLGKAQTERPKGEPLLLRLSDIEAAQPELGATARLLSLVDAWEKLVVLDDGWTETGVAPAAEQRALAIFGSLAEWEAVAGAAREHCAKCGRNWALLTLGFGEPAAPIAVRNVPKALAILAMSAALEREAGIVKRAFGALRLNFFALTGL